MGLTTAQWLEFLGAFLLVCAVGIAWALLKHEMGKEGERLDDFMKWLALFDYWWGWVLVIIGAAGMFLIGW